MKITLLYISNTNDITISQIVNLFFQINSELKWQGKR